MSAEALAAAMTSAIGVNDEHQGIDVWLDTGFPPLNKAISGRYDGGFPCGRMVEVFGPPSSGKTAIATQAMIAAQKAGGIAGFSDHERAFDIRLARDMGLDDTPGRWVFKTPKTFEDSVDKAMKAGDIVRGKKLIAPEAPIVWVFDSLASMVPESKMAKGLDGANMTDKLALATATSQSFPVLMQLAEEYNMLLLFLNQSRTKIGVMFGDTTSTPGGNAPEFYASVRIKLGRRQITKGEGDAKRVLGQQIGAQCVKNKVNRPFEKAKWDFMFNDDGSGYFDVVGSLVKHMVEIGTLEKSPSGRITWTDGKTYFESVLIKKINDEGLRDELFAMLKSD